MALKTPILIIKVPRLVRFRLKGDLKPLSPKGPHDPPVPWVLKVRVSGLGWGVWGRGFLEFGVACVGFFGV